MPGRLPLPLLPGLGRAVLCGQTRVRFPLIPACPGLPPARTHLGGSGSTARSSCGDNGVREGPRTAHRSLSAPPAPRSPPSLSPQPVPRSLSGAAARTAVPGRAPRPALRARPRVPHGRRFRFHFHFRFRPAGSAANPPPSAASQARSIQHRTISRFFHK